MKLQRIAQSLVAIGAIAAMALVAAPAQAAEDEYPTDPQKALEHYEGNVEDWAEGPVGWIMLEDEEDKWDDLQTMDARKEFINAFWQRRDVDPRDEGNLVKTAFYTRVARANELYQGFPRGWKSDRGRTHVVLGAPDTRLPHMGMGYSAVEWTYFTAGPRALGLRVQDSFGEFSILFVDNDEDGSYDYYTETGLSVSMPPVVQNALQWAKEAYVVNPDVHLTAQEQNQSF